MTELRYELAVSRIREMMDEETVEEKFRDYFRTVGAFVLLIDETNQKLRSGSFEKYSMEELAAWNAKLYEDILPDVYDRSYGNPAYATEKLGAEYGPVLSALYAEIRGAIAYVYEQKIEYLDILFELFVEIYNQFEEGPVVKNVQDTIYWYASDYCDVEQNYHEQSYREYEVSEQLKEFRHIHVACVTLLFVSASFLEQ